MISVELKIARIRKKLSRSQVAKDTGITANKIANYENEVSIPSVKTLKTLADYYNVSIDTLIGE